MHSHDQEAYGKLLMSHLRRHLLANGLSQSDVARMLNVDQSSVCHWVNGRKTPSPKHFPALAKLLGLDPYRLTEVIEPPVSAK